MRAPSDCRTVLAEQDTGCRAGNSVYLACRPDSQARTTKPTYAMRSRRTSPQIPPKKRILIIDGHPLLRRGLTALIDNEPDLSVCGEAATQREGLDAIAATTPDLVIADVQLEDGDGLDLVKQIRLHHQHLPVLLISMNDQPQSVERALQAGANGYVSKQQMSETVLTAIRCVLDGEQYVSPDIREGLVLRG